jgi:hypothetical protein
MPSRFRRLARLRSCLLMFGIAAYATEPAKTVVSDTIYRADGSPASGAVVIAWPAFVTAEAVTNKDIVDAEQFRGGLGQITDAPCSA